MILYPIIILGIAFMLGMPIAFAMIICYSVFYA